MDLSKLDTEERRKIELESLSKAEFFADDLILDNHGEQFLAELRRHFAGIHIVKLKIKAFNDLLWGSMGMQQFTNELLNNVSFKEVIEELLPFDAFYSLKHDITIGGNLFNLLGDLSGMIKQGGCYGSGSDLKNEDILKITKCFIDQNLKDGYKMYHYIKINEPWSRWFGYQPIYSITYLLISLHRDEMIMICVADDD